MAALQGVRTLLCNRPTVTLRCAMRIISVQLTQGCLLRKLCSSDARHGELKLTVNTENKILLENLNLMGVDVKMARQRQPGVLRKTLTNEQGVAQFLQGKGASHKVIASIISRYPRAITRSIYHLDQRWQLWRNIFPTDSEIVNILARSPESFFRSSDNENLHKNITFLTSLGLNTKDLYRLLKTAPRTFSNSLELNRHMVEFLEDAYAELGGKNPEKFVKAVLSRNLYILTRSTKRVRTNIIILKEYLKLSNSELLDLLEGPGAEILDFSNGYLKKNFNNLTQKMVALGLQKADIKKIVTNFPMVLYSGPDTMNSKLDCLIQGGIPIEQILEKPKVLENSTQTISERLDKLKSVGYDFQKNGISVLNLSRKRFVAKMEKLSLSSHE